MRGVTILMPNGRAIVDRCPRCQGEGGGEYGTCEVCSGRGTVNLQDLEHRIVDRCRIPTSTGPCGHIVVASDHPRAMEFHVRECAPRNIAAIHEARQQQHPDIMRPWDPELEAWITRHRVPILEGRMTI